MSRVVDDAFKLDDGNAGWGAAPLPQAPGGQGCGFKLGSIFGAVGFNPETEKCYGNLPSPERRRSRKRDIDKRSSQA